MYDALRVVIFRGPRAAIARAAWIITMAGGLPCLTYDQGSPLPTKSGRCMGARRGLLLGPLCLFGSFAFFLPLLGVGGEMGGVGRKNIT